MERFPSAGTVPPSDDPPAHVPLGIRVRDVFGDYLGAVNLNLGCGFHPEPGFVNVDRVPGPGVDLVRDLERVGPDDALGSADSVDCVVASHVLEHIVNLIPLMREIHRVLRPGGYLLAAAPHASSDDAWEDPTHVRAFTERSWYYFDERLYATPGHAGHYPSPVDFTFDVVQVMLIPTMEAQVQASHRGAVDQRLLMTWIQERRNVVREVAAILRKVPHA